MGTDQYEQPHLFDVDPPARAREALVFDAHAAKVAGAQGMESAYRAQRVQLWKEAASEWLDGLEPGALFTADDLVAAIGLPDEGKDRNNVVGAWTSAQAKRGRIVWTQRFGKSERVVRHGNTQRVWKKV